MATTTSNDNNNNTCHKNKNVGVRVRKTCLLCRKDLTMRGAVKVIPLENISMVITIKTSSKEEQFLDLRLVAFKLCTERRQQVQVEIIESLL